MTCSEIIEALGVVVTTAALFVAICANRKATKTLNISLKMHEQSKNVDLLDKRIDIISDIEKKTEVDEVKLQLLFDDKIVAVYNELQNRVAQVACAEMELGTYRFTLKASGFLSRYEELEELEHKALDVSATPEDEAVYEEKSKEYQIEILDELDNESKIYNYQDLSDNINQKRFDLTAFKEDLIDMMREFINESISPIQNK